MTAKEAAKQSAAWLSHYRWAAAFVAGGGLVALLGLSLDELPDWTKLSGAVSTGWGLMLWISEHYVKKTSTATADQVTERLWQQIGGIQTAVNEHVLPGMQQLSERIDEHKQETSDWLNTHDDQIGQLGAAVEKIKPGSLPGWKLGLGS